MDKLPHKLRSLFPRSIKHHHQLEAGLAWYEDWIKGGSITVPAVVTHGTPYGRPGVPKHVEAVEAAKRFQEASRALLGDDTRLVTVQVVLHERGLAELARELSKSQGIAMASGDVAVVLRVGLDHLAAVYDA